MVYQKSKVFSNLKAHTYVATYNLRPQWHFLPASKNLRFLIFLDLIYLYLLKFLGFIYLFIFREKGREVERGKKHQSAASRMHLNQGLGLQTRHVP